MATPSSAAKKPAASSSSSSSSSATSSSSSSSATPKVKTEGKDVKETKGEGKGEAKSDGNGKAAKAAGGAGGGGGGGGGGASFDKAAFWARYRVFVDLWRAGDTPWQGVTEKKAGAPAASPPPPGDVVDAILIGQGPENEDILYCKTSALQLLFFGYELWDSIMLFSMSPGATATAPVCTLTIVTAPKKAKLVRELGDGGSTDLRVRVVEKDKTTVLATVYENLIKLIKASKKGRRVGYVKKDLPKEEDAKKSSLVPKCIAAVEKAGLDLVDVSSALARVLMVKDEAALRHCRRAGRMSTEVLKQHLIAAVEHSIEADTKIKHSKLAEDTEDIIGDTSKLKLEEKLDPDAFESCYTPIIQSGGEFDLKASATSNDNNLDHTTVVYLALGVKYKGFCSNIARTYFINPTTEQKELYQILCAVREACLAALKPGNKASAVWDAAMRVIKGRKSALLNHFTKTCGFGIGLEFRESDLLLGPKNDLILAAGMVFNLAVGFDGLVKGGKLGDKATASKETKEEKKGRGHGKAYAMMIADTVIVTTSDVAEIITNVARGFDKVSYELDEEVKPGDTPRGGDGSDDDGDSKGGGGGAGAGGPRTRGAKEGKRTPGKGTVDEHKLREHQARLQEKQRDEALRRTAKDGADKNFKNTLSEKDGKFVSYPDASHFPPEAKSAKSVLVDATAESILCPIGGQMVPFHIQTLKNSHKSEENGYFYLRLQFNIPPATVTAASQLPPWVNIQQKFLRELTYRSKTQVLNKAFFEIQELRKRVQNRLKEHQARSSLVEQEDLKVDMKRGAVARLKDLQIKPQLTGRRGNAGALEAHVNGLRFISNQKLKIEIIYKNIKHAFFQPAEKSTINVLLHFELHNPIILGKKKAKKTNYVQFFVETMEASQDLDSRGRQHDEDGTAEDEEERRNRNKWNEQFRQFVKKVEEHCGREQDTKLEFDSPYRELVFTGTPSKSIVDIMPSVHCLVALDDLPPMVVTLADVEVAVFERVQFNLRNFDLVFILKGLDIYIPILAIPSKHFDSVKQWLNSCDIVFYEMAHNILWKRVLKEIKADLHGFYQEGGWEHLSKGDASSGEEEEDSGDDAEPAAEGKEGKGEAKGKGKAPAKKAKAKKKRSEESESESDFAPSGSDDDDSEEFGSGSEVDDDDDAEESSDDGASKGAGKSEKKKEKKKGGGSSDDEEDDDDEGPDWDEHARRAQASDRKKHADDSDDDDRGKKKRKK